MGCSRRSRLGSERGREVGQEARGEEHLYRAEKLVLVDAFGRRGHDEDVVPDDIAVAVPSAQAEARRCERGGRASSPPAHPW